MKLKAITTFDDLEEIWLLDDADPVEDEIVLPERGEDNNAEL